MENDKFMVAFMDSGECLSISEITTNCLKAIKQVTTNRLRFNPDTPIKIINSPSESVTNYFIAFIDQARTYYKIQRNVI